MLDDDFEDDKEEDDYDREIPRVRRYKGGEDFDPEPPMGWWIVTSYQTTCPLPYDIALWYYAVSHAQEWSRVSGKRQYMLTRDPNDRRVLLVSPLYSGEADDLIETANSTFAHCNCGGSDCFFRDIQVSGMRTFAKRAWNRVPTSARLEISQIYEQNNGQDFPIDILGGPEELDDIEDQFLLLELLEAATGLEENGEGWLITHADVESYFRRAA